MSINKSSLTLAAPDPPAALAVDDNGDPNKTAVVIIGAGPAGLLAACLLKKADAATDIKVFDMRERPTSFYGSYPIVLNKRGLTGLEQLGPEIIAKIHAVGIAVDRLDVQNKGKTMAKVDTYGVCIMRDQLVGLLMEVADQMDVPIYWKHKFISVDIDNRSVVFEPESDESLKITVPVQQALVGADGNYSRVRRECEKTHHLLTVEESEWGIEMRYLQAPNPETTLPPEVDDRVHYVLGGDGYVCYQPGGKWSLSFPIKDESDAFLSSDDPSPANIAKLKSFCEEKAAVFAEHLLTSDEYYASFFRSRAFSGTIIKCSTLAPTDWIALIGDAAHGVAPFTGEGANSSLESAAILVATLVSGSKNPCADFDDARRDDAHALQELALRNRRIIVGTRAQKFVGTFGTIILSIGKKMGLVSSTMQEWMLGAKAKDAEPVSYTILRDMDKRQRRFIEPVAMFIFTIVNLFTLKRTHTKQQ